MIIREHHPRQYTTIPTPTLRDNRLSLEALGLLVRLLSFPDIWEIKVGPLGRDCGVGRDKLQSLLRELRSVGYLRHEQYRGQGGRWEWISEVYDQSHIQIAAMPNNGKAGDGKAGDGKAGDISINDSTTDDLANKQLPQLKQAGEEQGSSRVLDSKPMGITLEQKRYCHLATCKAQEEGRITTSFKRYEGSLLRLATNGDLDMGDLPELEEWAKKGGAGDRKLKSNKDSGFGDVSQDSSAGFRVDVG